MGPRRRRRGAGGRGRCGDRPDAAGAAPIGNSSYHALNLKLEKRYSHGLHFRTNYTWAKFIDDVNSRAEVGNDFHLQSDSPARHAHRLPLGRPFAPYGDAPGDLWVLGRPLAEVQAAVFGAAGLAIVINLRS